MFIFIIELCLELNLESGLLYYKFDYKTTSNLV